MIFISLIIKPLIKADDFCEYRRGYQLFLRPANKNEYMALNFE